MKIIAVLLMCLCGIFFQQIQTYAQWSTTNPVTFIPAGNGGKADGATVTSGALIGCNDSGTALNLGIDAAGPQYSWIQSRSRASLLMMNLALNPWGGNV